MIARNLPLKKTRKKVAREISPKDFWDRYWGCVIQLLGSISNDDGDGNENGNKAIGLNSGKTTTLHVHHAFLYISLPSLHDYK